MLLLSVFHFLWEELPAEFFYRFALKFSAGVAIITLPRLLDYIYVVHTQSYCCNGFPFLSACDAPKYVLVFNNEVKTL